METFPVIVTAPDVDTNALAPESPIVRPPAASTVNVALSRTVSLFMANRPPMLSPRVAIVNVIDPAAVEANLTRSNSVSARLAPANVIVCAVLESNTI